MWGWNLKSSRKLGMEASRSALLACAVLVSCGARNGSSAHAAPAGWSNVAGAQCAPCAAPLARSSCGEHARGGWPILRGARHRAPAAAMLLRLRGAGDRQPAGDRGAEGRKAEAEDTVFRPRVLEDALGVESLDTVARDSVLLQSSIHPDPGRRRSREESIWTKRATPLQVCICRAVLLTRVAACRWLPHSMRAAALGTSEGSAAHKRSRHQALSRSGRR